MKGQVCRYAAEGMCGYAAPVRVLYLFKVFTLSLVLTRCWLAFFKTYTSTYTSPWHQAAGSSRVTAHNLIDLTSRRAGKLGGM
jgi:hypothetical protein